VLEFWSLDNSSSKRSLDVLETIYLILRKTVVQRITVVKLGVYDGGGHCFGSVKVKVGTDTAKSMQYARHEQQSSAGRAYRSGRRCDGQHVMEIWRRGCRQHQICDNYDFPKLSASLTA